MTLDEVYKYLRLMKPRYLQADRAGKSVLLNEMEAVTGRHRKSLIRRLQGSVQRQPRVHERECTYKTDVDLALRRIWESYDYICAERLHPNLVNLAQQLATHGELELPATLQSQLGEIGLTTVRERLRHFRQDEPQLPRRAAAPRSRALADIPMQRIAWDEPVPGHFEVDLVFHSGPDASGEYGHTLQMIDVYSGWSERVAILGRSYRVMEDGFRRLLQRVPFAVTHIHPDNGSEFFNDHMRTFWTQYPHVQLSRSRPYQKNDNRF
ncbi:MAG TPA: transposase family protein, partial [Levilinea sp.]|nr:transposase family protein [Levilinea sp.]